MPPLSEHVFELSLEQKFHYHQLLSDIDRATPDQLKELLREEIRQNMIKDNTIKFMAKHGGCC